MVRVHASEGATRIAVGAMWIASTLDALALGLIINKARSGGLPVFLAVLIGIFLVINFAAVVLPRKLNARDEQRIRDDEREFLRVRNEALRLPPDYDDGA